MLLQHFLITVYADYSRCVIKHWGETYIFYVAYFQLIVAVYANESCYEFAIAHTILQIEWTLHFNLLYFPIYSCAACKI